MPLKINNSAFVFIMLSAVSVTDSAGQGPGKLTLQQAESMALKNHPQVLAAQNEVSYADQQVIEARSAYYPALNGEVTGSGGNHGARIGAGDFPASRIIDRFGQGIVLSQLITDSGRTANLIANSRLQAQASSQTYQATRYDVLLQVNRAYFEVLRSRGLVRVAEGTVAARQLLSKQINQLAKNNLKSQLDVSFGEVNVSQANLLLLLSANSGVQQALAELARALGSDQISSYELVDEPLPPGPPSKPEDLIAQAMEKRPEIAGLRLSREAAYKFENAEKDLSRPTVTLVGSAGFLPWVVPPTSTPIPAEYEGAAVNVNIPVFNGHLFGARREAARYRALESDQRLRDEQQRVARDVRVAWAAALTAFQRIDVTAQFLRQAAIGLHLAEGRYNLGLSSIVELTQAQLNLTQAEVDNLNAKYDYQSQYSALQYATGQLR